MIIHCCLIFMSLFRLLVSVYYYFLLSCSFFGRPLFILWWQLLNLATVCLISNILHETFLFNETTTQLCLAFSLIRGQVFNSIVREKLDIVFKFRITVSDRNHSWVVIRFMISTGLFTVFLKLYHLLPTEGSPMLTCIILVSNSRFIHIFLWVISCLLPCTNLHLIDLQLLFEISAYFTMCP
jgi:hypothetical protein